PLPGPLAASGTLGLAAFTQVGPPMLRGAARRTAGASGFGGLLLLPRPLRVPGRSEVRQRAARGGDDPGAGVGRRVIGTVQPHVRPVHVPEVGPHAVGLEPVMGTAQAREVVARGAAAARGIVVVERDD